MFFGGGQQNNEKRGRNMDIELPVTLEDLYVGNEKSATIKRCGGTGTGIAARAFASRRSVLLHCPC